MIGFAPGATITCDASIDSPRARLRYCAMASRSSRCTMCRPLASSARARARTSKAVSVPSRPMRFASGRISPSLARPAGSAVGDGGDFSLYAGAALRADHRRVWRAGGKDHPIARFELDHAAVAEPEIDRALGAIQELGVTMGVFAVTVAGAV